MDDQGAVGVLDAGAHLEEEAEFLFFVECGGEFGAGLTFDVLHEEVAKAEGGGAGIDEAGDVVVFEGGEDLGFAVLECRVGLDEDDLDGDVFLEVAIGAGAFVDDAHAAATDFLGGGVGTEGLATESEHGGLEEVALVFVGGEEVFHLLTELAGGGALLVEPGEALGGREVEGLIEEAFEAIPGVAGRHGNRIADWGRRDR
jgi:hypothetical protein